MRNLILITVLFAAAFCYIEPEIYADISPFAFEEEINQTLQDIVANLSDPVVLELIELSFPPEEGAVIVGDGTISNLVVSGLKDFQVPELIFSLIGLQLNATVIVPAVDLYTDFDLNLTIADTIPVYGVGKISAHVDELQVVISGNVNLAGGVSVHDLRVQIYIVNATDENDLPSIDIINWADGLLFVYSITNRNSFTYLKRLETMIADSDIPVYIVANKSDMVHLREVSAEEGAILARDFECGFCEVAAAEQVAPIALVFEEICRAVLASRRKSKHSLLERMLGSKTSNLKLYVRGKSDSALPKD